MSDGLGLGLELDAGRGRGRGFVACCLLLYHNSQQLFSGLAHPALHIEAHRV
jgi:hypothetical protein